ncbi:helix-turn-helix domain-containing protein [Ruegeria lacuscaerulensis]|uniref:helix-turn-helix domain-containing protein n=1 Tax=Ruegeria lacuscaerulensis TaxID=55218 RepID=UPI00147CA0FD|nr:helix-turn-helix domain-containing protein [Ruegeria lacuscaerulensis]
MGTVSKALKILGYFSEGSSEFGLSEISRLTGQNKATVYRYLCELESNSFLEQDTSTKEYRLGSAIFDLARLSNSDVSFLNILAQVLEVASEEASCWAFLYSVQPKPLVPLLVFNQGRPQEGTFQEISTYSSPGVCLCAVCDQALSDVAQLNSNKSNWDAATSEFRAQGVAPSPEANSSTTSLSAPIFGAAGAASFIVTLARSRNPTKQELIPLNSAVLLAARSGTAAIGGTRPSTNPKEKLKRSHSGVALHP